MLLEFRTKRDVNGNAKYLAIDTGAEMFSRSPSGWISKDIPELKKRDYDFIIDKARRAGYTERDKPIF